MPICLCTKFPEKTHISVWYDFYKNHLINMYNLFITSYEKIYLKRKINWNKEKIFKKFCILIYKTSNQKINNFEYEQ